MRIQTIITASIALALGGCVTGPAASKCTATGAEFLGSSETNDDVCDKFERRLVQSLNGGEAAMQDLTIQIAISKKGAIEAAITTKDGSKTHQHPPITMDVIDRPLKSQDIDNLADAVANMLNTSGAGA